MTSDDEARFWQLVERLRTWVGHVPSQPLYQPGVPDPDAQRRQDLADLLSAAMRLPAVEAELAELKALFEASRRAMAQAAARGDDPDAQRRTYCDAQGVRPKARNATRFVDDDLAALWIRLMSSTFVSADGSCAQFRGADPLPGFRRLGVWEALDWLAALMEYENPEDVARLLRKVVKRLRERISSAPNPESTLYLRHLLDGLTTEPAKVPGGRKVEAAANRVGAKSA